MTPAATSTRIVVPEFLPQRHLEILSERAEVVYDPDLYADRPHLLDEVATAAAVLIRNRTRVDEEFLEAAGEMRVVGRLGVGLDNIDIEAATRHGVRVIPALGGNAVSVAEYVMGAMLILQRPVYQMTESMVAGRWPRQGHAFGRELKDQVLGLVGFGHIAREVARRAGGFGMEILACDPFLDDDHEAWALARRVDLCELLSLSDVVSLHLPLDDTTHGLIDGSALERMKEGAVLINTARGGIVDEAALAKALRGGHLRGAAVDVFASEPLDPELAAVFAGLDNLVLTPHLAGNTEESVDRVATMTVEAVLGALAG